MREDPPEVTAFKNWVMDKDSNSILRIQKYTRKLGFGFAKVEPSWKHAGRLKKAPNWSLKP